MELILKQMNVLGPDGLVQGDFAVHNDCISALASPDLGPGTGVFSGCYLFPGFVDVHVHLREPGFSYKETIAAGSRAGAHGGYVALGAMPNLNPVPEDLDTLRPQLDLIRRDAVIDVHPYGAITRGQNGEALADLEALAPYVIGFSDDGRGVQNRDMMRQAMLAAKALGKPIVAHCEDNSLLHGGVIHDGDYARAHGLPGICSQSEWGQIERDLRLAEETGCAYHVCHISAKESVTLIRQAKARGVDVTCETAPHYLLLDDSMLEDDGRFRMNPPIRSKADREALIEGLLDGTIDMIATDHAPHSAQEKAGGLQNSLNGIVGLEAAFPVLYTGLVRQGILSLDKLMDLMHYNPARRFGLDLPFSEGAPASFTVFDLNTPYTLDPDTFLSQGRATPFAGWQVYGKCLMTVHRGRVVWMDGRCKEAMP